MHQPGHKYRVKVISLLSLFISLYFSFSPTSLSLLSLSSLLPLLPLNYVRGGAPLSLILSLILSLSTRACPIFCPVTLEAKPPVFLTPPFPSLPGSLFPLSLALLFPSLTVALFSLSPWLFFPSLPGSLFFFLPRPRFPFPLSLPPPSLTGSFFRSLPCSL